MLISEIIQLVEGEIVGSSEGKINKVSTLEEAQEEDLAFCLEEKHSKKVFTTKAKVIIVPDSFNQDISRTLIKVKNPRYALIQVLNKFVKTDLMQKGIHKTAVIGRNVTLGKDVNIGACAVIEDNVVIGNNASIFGHVHIGKDSKVGDETIIYSNVSIYHEVTIGKNVIIHSGAIIGADGFGFVKTDNKYEKIPQIGGVIIEDEVEVGASSTIDRGTIGNTIIGRGSKIDNLVMVAHNCVLGENCALVGNVALSGSTILGNNVSMGGQAGTKGHLKIGDNSICMARAGVTKDVDNEKIVSGFPAQDHDKEMKIKASLRKLPELLEKVKKLEEKVACFRNTNSLK